MSARPVWKNDNADEPGSIFGVLLRAVFAFVGLYVLVLLLCGLYFAITTVLAFIAGVDFDEAGYFTEALTEWPMPMHRAALGLVVGGTLVALLRRRGAVISRPGFMLASLACAGVFYVLTPVDALLEPIRAQFSHFGMQASDKRALAKREAPEQFREYLARNSELKALIGAPVSSRELFAVGGRGDRIRVFCVRGDSGNAYAVVRQMQSNDSLYLDCPPRKVEGACGQVALVEACGVTPTASWAVSAQPVSQVTAPAAAAQVDDTTPATQPQPLADGERCIGGQRMRRVENGWVQAGVCS